MSWDIDWGRQSIRDLRSMDRQVAERVRAAVRRYAATEQGDVIRLTGRPESLLRVGDWRVLFEFDYDAHVIRVKRILPRGRAYRD